MSTNAWIIVLSLTVVCIVGIIVFLAQFRTRRSTAMLALVIAMFATLTLCALTFLGGAFQTKPLGDKQDLGGFPFPVGTTWVYSRTEYQQVIGDPTHIIMATRVYTDTVLQIEGSGPALAFVEQRTVSPINAPLNSKDWMILDPGQKRYRMEDNQVLETRSADHREDIVLYDFPLELDKRWCVQPLQPPNASGCNELGRREVESRTSYATALGTFDDCFQILDPYYAGGTEWFCNGVGVVARKYDHSGTRFGFEDTLIRFSAGSPSR